MKNLLGEVTKEQLIGDFKIVMADIEALLKATAHQGGEELAQVRARAEESLSIVKSRVSQEQAALVASTRQAVKLTDDYVHENPWSAVGVAASLGLVVGLLSARH